MLYWKTKATQIKTKTKTISVNKSKKQPNLKAFNWN